MVGNPKHTKNRKESDMSRRKRSKTPKSRKYKTGAQTTRKSISNPKSSRNCSKKRVNQKPGWKDNTWNYDTLLA